MSVASILVVASFLHSVNGQGSAGGIHRGGQSEECSTVDAPPLSTPLPGFLWGSRNCQACSPALHL